MVTACKQTCCVCSEQTVPFCSSNGQLLTFVYVDGFFLGDLWPLLVKLAFPHFLGSSSRFHILGVFLRSPNQDKIFLIHKGPNKQLALKQNLTCNRSHSLFRKICDACFQIPKCISNPSLKPRGTFSGSLTMECQQTARLDTRHKKWLWNQREEKTEQIKGFLLPPFKKSQFTIPLSFSSITRAIPPRSMH